MRVRRSCSPPPRAPLRAALRLRGHPLHCRTGRTTGRRPRPVHLDSVAPGGPPLFSGGVADDGLPLGGAPPSDVVANYVLFVNGQPWKNLGSTEFEIKMGPFDATDTRTFSVVAVDMAGNVGATSPVLVGVPNLVGLDWTHALGATSARGLGLKRDAIGFASIPMFVTS